MMISDGGVTAPKGFLAAGIAAGIKKSGKDMAMIFSEVPCRTAGTFTSNLVKAAPVIWDMRIVREMKTAQACVMNSGVANACTGEEGYLYCSRTADAAAKALGIRPEMVLTASTGVIGRQLPMEKIEEGIRKMVPMLSPGREAARMAVDGIMTTDTVRKEASASFQLGGKTVTIGAMTKGAGMIHPQMCTMLAFITTDACISDELLSAALYDSVRNSFNMISVDGDTSTNDTCLILANGLAGNEEITEADSDGYRDFCRALQEVTVTLAKKMAADGEGATALLEVKVIGAVTREQAVTISKSVITSNLVKTAIAGHDANWGRIMCAMGYSGAVFEPDRTDLYFESAAGCLQIIANGVATDYDEEKATAILSEKEITVLIDLKMGSCEATAWGCDLTHEYISINADYRS